VNFLLFQAATQFKEWIFAEITGDRPRQPAYEIKLMLSRVSWALAQISCWHAVSLQFYFFNSKIGALFSFVVEGVLSASAFICYFMFALRSRVSQTDVEQGG